MTQTPTEQPAQAESILASTKKQLGIVDEDTSFDLDVIFAINTVFADLNQLGIGPDAGFMIQDRSAVWADYLHDNNLLNSVATYMYLRCRLIFDPPQTSYLIGAFKEQVDKMEWRLTAYREYVTHPFDPDAMPVVDGDIILDGGGA
jgi:hypothetical protein